MSKYMDRIDKHKVQKALLDLGCRQDEVFATDEELRVEHGWDNPLKVWFVTVYSEHCVDALVEFYAGTAPWYMGRRMSRGDLVAFHSAIGLLEPAYAIALDLPY